jgi:hypothetical protein
MGMTDRRVIIKEYHDTLDKLKLRKWAGFLESKKYWIRYEPDSNFGYCNICFQENVTDSYVGSHFQQTGTKFKEHYEACKEYSLTLKKIFEDILKKHDLEMRDNLENTFYAYPWLSARLYTQHLLNYWNETIEPLKKESEEKCK